MSLLDTLRSGIATIDSATKSLQADVGYRRYVASDVAGAKIYEPAVGQPAVTLKAIVEVKDVQVREDGIVSTIRGTVLTILDLPTFAAAAGANGLTDEDYFSLANGRQLPIVMFDGFVDAGNGRLMPTRVVLG